MFQPAAAAIAHLKATITQLMDRRDPSSSLNLFVSYKTLKPMQLTMSLFTLEQNKL